MAVRAPQWNDTLWVDSPALNLVELRGKKVLLDFFTYGCINCLNNLSAIKQLQNEYPDLRVIGVHTGKFTREKESASILKAMKRLGITYRVINDADAKLFDAYAIKAWPTMVLIDEGGYIIGQFSGEGKSVDIRKLLKESIFKVSMSEEETVSIKQLHYPEKLLCTEEYLFIANTGADCIWQCDYNGDILAIYEGLYSPMGMAFQNGTLYVANRGENSVVKIDLSTKKKMKVLEGLSAPYDLMIEDNLLVIALTGSHEILLYDLNEQKELLRIGNRFEALRDGDFETVQLAQPSGLSACGDRIWFVDAESSSLRCIENTQVKSYIGEGLFTFGDSNEKEILLQHPQDVVCGKIGDGCGGGRLFIADTYNHKIKAYDPESGTSMTLLDNLHEPCGISKKGCELFVADTNAHQIIRYDLSKMRSENFNIQII